MTGPRVLGRIDDHTRLDRVEVNVAQQGQKVGIGINPACSVTALEQMATRIQSLVAVPGVSHGDALHNAPERVVGDLPQSV